MRLDRRTVLKKLNKSSGFTLAEALVTVLILLMVSSVVAAGIPAAKNAYEKVVLASNAEVLLSTTISTLRNELGTANSVTIDGSKIDYFNPSIHSDSMIDLNTGKTYLSGDVDGVIVYRRYAGTNIGSDSKGDGSQSDVTRLISEKASTEGLYVTYKSVAKNDKTGTITFEKLSVNQAANGTKTKENIAKRETLSIRVISY